MKSSLVLCLLLCLLLANFRGNDAIRKEPASTTTTEEYWKKVMKDEPLPKSIKELLVFEAAGDGDHAAAVEGEKKVAINRFVKDFDTLTTAIIYHNTQSHGG
ncbi:unnamed protein product [Linum tenue]|uniref:Uncharacterized protein n=1 Tax=Linum tenue TaxID=586396 RepID=A0AAV0GW62_9ROSI|nr:unnamed protein product [Linum tenue]